MPEIATDLPTPGDLLTAREVMSMLRLSRSAVYRLTAAGRLPAPIRLSQRTCRWRRQDLLAALAKSSKQTDREAA